jgi:hypothetical protein
MTSSLQCTELLFPHEDGPKAFNFRIFLPTTIIRTLQYPLTNLIQKQMKLQRKRERFPLSALRQKVEDLAYLSRYFRRIFKADYENLSVSNQLWPRVNLTCLIPAVLKQKAIYLFLSFWNELHVELADYSVQRK